MYYPSASDTHSGDIDELERRFFDGLVLRNGVRKTTRLGRLATLDRWAQDIILEQRFEPPLHILDVAASSGVTALEWSRRMDESGISHQMIATDACVDAQLVSYGRFFHVLVDSTGYPLQYELLGLAFRGEAQSRKGRRGFGLPYLVCRLIHGIAKVFEPSLERRASSGDGGATYQRRRVRMVTHRLLESNHIVMTEENLFEAPTSSDRFDVIRAANILNESYFSPDDLRRAFRALTARLGIGGLLIVARDVPEGPLEGTILKLQPDGDLQVIARLNGGSEIERVPGARITSD